MIFKRFIVNARKPEGRLGRMMASGMNGGTHEKLAKWGMTHFTVQGDVLDIGCGGGGNIKRMLNMDSVKTVSGVDYSKVSVDKTSEVNAVAISNGRCKVVQSNVLDIPFDKNSFDTVTAFETIYFWPRIERSFEEVFRVTRPGGIFAITNESDGVDEASVKYAKVIDGMNLYTPDRICELLEGAGFTDIQVFKDDRKPWINVSGKKPEGHELVSSFLNLHSGEKPI
jgi:ubiquinone/menaquinone biosynthesis C-methylase UbiE